MKTQSATTRKITVIGVFCAIAFILAAASNAIPIKFNDFLGFDFKDCIIAMAGFALGPVPVLIISVIVSFLEMILISQTGPIGMIMNILSSVTFSVIPALLYKKNTVV